MSVARVTLKEEHFNALKGGLVDRVTTHTDTVLGYLRENDVEISRYILLDHMDWLAEVKSHILEAEWQAMVDRAAPHTRFMWRSAGMRVEFVDPIPVTVNNQKRTDGRVVDVQHGTRGGTSSERSRPYLRQFLHRRFRSQ